MKKKLLSVLICAAMVTTMLSACGSTAPATEEPATEEPAAEESVAEESAAEEPEEPAAEEGTEAAGGQKIGISVPKAVTGWTAAIQYYAERYCKDNNLDATVVAAENTNEQANQIEELINMKCDAIVLLPINDELATAAQKVMDAGITLVNYDRTLGSTTPDYYVAGDNKGLGVLGANYEKDKLGETYKSVILGVSGWGAISEERINGYVETIGGNVDVLGEYSAENAAQESGLALMTDVLSAQPEIDAVFTVDDELALGAVQAIHEANRTDIKVISGGGGSKGFMNKMTADENKDIWMASQTYYPNMINDAIATAVKVLNGETVETTYIVPSEIVDRENVEAWRTEQNIDPDAPY